MPPSQNKVSKGTAKVIPFFVAAVATYASYVIIGPLSVEFLLNPPAGQPTRLSAGLAIPITYGALLIPVIATWLRLLLVVWLDPGYTPLGQPRDEAMSEPTPGLEQFWQREVFACDAKGFPIWCSQCNNWKPDRTHHNQDVGRCTLKMDHFCPWVGGVVGERSYKFFIQFNFYSFLLSGFSVGVLAFYVAKGHEGSTLQVQWIVALGLAGFFALFTFGMVANSLWMTFRNVTSIENIDYHFRTTLLAVLLPPDLQGKPLEGPPLPPPAHMRHDHSSSQSRDSDQPLASEIDDPSHSSYFMNRHASRRRNSALLHQHRIWKGTVTYPLYLDPNRPPLPAPQPRTFAILETLPGMNVWDIGTPYLNFKAVFGEKLHDWLLPIKHSPCCNHNSLVTQYPLGPDFEELLVEAGLQPRHDNFDSRNDANAHDWMSSTTSRKRRRKRILDPGWQNGERPQGWWSEKEARRIKHDARRRSRGDPP